MVGQVGDLVEEEHGLKNDCILDCIVIEEEHGFNIKIELICVFLRLIFDDFGFPPN